MDMCLPQRGNLKGLAEELAFMQKEIFKKDVGEGRGKIKAIIFSYKVPEARRKYLGSRIQSEAIIKKKN